MQRRGEVLIGPVEPVPADGSMIDPARGRFWAVWEDETAEGLVEEVEVDGADAAIAWGRERSCVVLIRLGNRGDTYFSAGDDHVADDEDEPFPVWPPDRPPTGGWWDPVTGHRDSIHFGN
jgi:hypothetical protein